MANIWDEFDRAIDTKALAEDVKKGGESPVYKEVPVGEYEVSVEKMELVKSKSGRPMVSIWFKIISEGEYKGSLLFWNQVVDQQVGIGIMNKFLRSLESGVDVEFETYRQYGNMIMDIHEAISGRLEYALKYSKNKKDYSVFEITEVYELED